MGKSPGEGKGYPLQYSGLENSMGCIVHGVAKSRTQLSDFHFQTNVSAFQISCFTFFFSLIGDSRLKFCFSSDGESAEHFARC